MEGSVAAQIIKERFMNLIQKFAMSIAFVSLLLCSNAFAEGPPVVKVEVVNTSDVTITNLPDTQTVSGTVSVDNFPTVQEVISLPPVLRTDRVQFSIFSTSGTFEELSVPSDVVLTDLVITFFTTTNWFCLLTVWQGVPDGANILLQPNLREISNGDYSLHLESGLQGLIAMRVSAGGSGSDGACIGTLFWTGYEY